MFFFAFRVLIKMFFSKNKTEKWEELPWWSSSLDSELEMQVAQLQYLAHNDIPHAATKSLHSVNKDSACCDQDPEQADK